VAYVKQHALTIPKMGPRNADSHLAPERQPSAIIRGLRRFTRRLSMALHPEDDGFIVVDRIGQVVIVTPNRWAPAPSQRIVVEQLPRSGLAAPTPLIPAGVLPRVPRVAPVDTEEVARAAEFLPIHEPQPGRTEEPVAHRGRDVPTGAAPVVAVPGKSIDKRVIASGMAAPLRHYTDRARVVEWLQATPMTVGGWAPASGSEASTSKTLGGDRGVGGCSDEIFQLVAPPSTRTSSDEDAPPAGARLLSPKSAVLQAATFHDKPGMNGRRKVRRSRIAHCWETASLG